MEAKLTGRQLKVKMKLEHPEEGRYTPDGVVAVDDMYVHSAHGRIFLCDATGFLDTCFPTPHAHDPPVAKSSLHYLERKDQFDILE